MLITALVIYTPLSFIVIQSFLSAPFFSPSKEWSFESFEFIFTDPDFYKALKSGFILAFGLVFISIPLGGVLAFGVIGVFLGPTLLALGYRLLSEWTTSAAPDQAV